jgi:uncharacterized protein
LSNNTFLHRQTSLSAHIVQFCRYLRTEGYTISATEESDALRTLEILQPYDNADKMQLALRTILCRSQSQIERFDELYAYYFKQIEKAVDSKIAEQERQEQKPKSKARQEEAQFNALRDWLFNNQSREEEIAVHTYSSDTVLGKKDFADMTDEEMQAVYELIQMIARRLAKQHNRRYRKDKSGILDIKRTLRQNLRRGGEMLEILMKKRQKRRVQLVLICDVSKSMELYSRFLIQFAYTFQQVFKRIETFVFSTKLIKTSDILRGSDFPKMLKDLSENIPEWSGGTRIGESFKQFVENNSTKCLTSKTIVLIMSDGWDTGEVDVLEKAMHTIHKKANKVIWINPLMGNPDFEPNTDCMVAALPYIDVLTSGHSIESLKMLKKYL